MTSARILEDLTGGYGPNWTTGVLAEHLYLAPDALIHRSPRGLAYVTGPRGGRAYPVLCGECREIPTEDGPVTGRCGQPVDFGGYACPGHTEEIDGWRAQSEAERIVWERRQDEEAAWSR